MSIYLFIKENMQGYKRRLLPFLLSSILRSLLLFGPALITGYMIDIVLPSKDKSLLIMFSIILVALPLLSAVSIIVELISTSFVLKLAGLFRVELYDCIQRNSLEWNQKWHSGDLLNRIMNEVDEIAGTIYYSSGFIIWHIVTILVGVFIMIQLGGFIGLLVSLMLVMKLFTVRYLSNKFKSLSKKQKELEASMVAKVNEGLNTIEYIKFSSIEEKVVDNFTALNSALAVSEEKTLLWKYIGKLLNLLIMALAVFIIFYMGSIKIVNKEMTIGTLISLFGVFTWSAQAFGSFYDLFINFIGMKPSFDRINEVYEDAFDGNYVGSRKDANFVKLELKNVSYTYEGNRILKDIDLSVLSKEKIAIIGSSGSGKSILTDIMLNLRTPTVGVVKLNGSPIKDFDNVWLRKQITTISQQNTLLTGTILESLSYASGEHDIETINNVLRIVELDKWIEGLPNGLNTVISGNNVFSGGEIQRLSIARGLLCASNCIIFDEITASLDNLNTDKILINILNKYADKTLIFVTHDQSILSKMDRVITIDDGTII